MNRRQKEQQNQEKTASKITVNKEAGVVTLFIVMAVMLLVLGIIAWTAGRRSDAAIAEMRTLNTQMEAKLKQTQTALTDIDIFRRDLWDKVDKALEDGL